LSANRLPLRRDMRYRRNGVSTAENPVLEPGQIRRRTAGAQTLVKAAETTGWST
jgi:hypothetical protein